MTARERAGSGRRRDAPSGRPDPARTERFRAAERRIAAVARVMDELIEVPGTGGRRFGLEPVIGLIPFLGDAATGLVGAWVVAEAARFQLPRVVLARMVVNVIVDLVLGLVPVIGDLLDFAFKANTRNLELFRRYALDPGAPTGSHRAFVAGLLLVVFGGAWLLLALLGRLLSLEVRLP